MQNQSQQTLSSEKSRKKGRRFTFIGYVLVTLLLGLVLAIPIIAEVISGSKWQAFYGKEARDWSIFCLIIGTGFTLTGLFLKIVFLFF